MKKNLIVYLILFIIVIFYIIFSITNSSNLIFTSDEFSYDFFINEYINNDTFCYKETNEFKFSNPSFIGPFVYNANGCNYPKHSFMRIIILIPLKLILGDFFIYYPILFGILCLISIYILTYEISQNEYASILSVLILATMPLFLHWSTFFFIDILNLFLFLTGIIFLMDKNKNNSKIFIAGLMFSILGLLRYSDFLIIIPSLSYLLYKRCALKKIFIFLIPVFISIVFILIIINTPIAKDWVFIQDQTIDNGTFQNISLFDSFKSYLSLESENINALKLNLIGIILFFKIWPIILFVFLVPIYKKNISEKGLIIFILILFIIFFLFYGRGNVSYGLGRVSLQTSFYRYLLPFFVLLIPLFSITISKLFEKSFSLKKLFIIISIVLISIFSIILLIDYPDYGINKVNSIKKNIDVNKKDMDFIIRSENPKIILVDGPSFQIFYPDINDVYYIQLYNQSQKELIFKLFDDSLKDNNKVYYVGTYYSGGIYYTQNLIFEEDLKREYNLNVIYSNDWTKVFEITKK